MFDKGQKQSSMLSCDSSYLFIIFILSDLQTLYCIGNKYLRNREQHKTGNYINKLN